MQQNGSWYPRPTRREKDRTFVLSSWSSPFSNKTFEFVLSAISWNPSRFMLCGGIQLNTPTARTVAWYLNLNQQGERRATTICNRLVPLVSSNHYTTLGPELEPAASLELSVTDPRVYSELLLRSRLCLFACYSVPKTLSHHAIPENCRSTLAGDQ